MYRPTRWQDHVSQFPDRFWEKKQADGSVLHIRDEGEILQEGTPQNAPNFNNIESGIVSALEQAAELTRISRHQQKLLANLQGEVGTVTLANSRVYPFNNSAVTIALAQPRNTTDYNVHIIDAAVNGGSDSTIGRLNAFDKLVNGFKLAFTGSAASVTVRYVVQGGMY